MAPASTPPRLPRHERPGFINDGSVLAAVNTASRRLWRWPSASVDRHCARRFWEGRPGRRNAAQPNKETFRSQMRHERRRTPRFSGGITPAFPKRRPCRDDGLGQAALFAGGACTEARQPRLSKIGPALSSSNTIRRQSSADPVQKHDPGSDKAQKGIDNNGPVTEANLPRISCTRISC
jgi:hypothetical protein